MPATRESVDMAFPSDSDLLDAEGGEYEADDFYEAADFDDDASALLPRFFDDEDEGVGATAAASSGPGVGAEAKRLVKSATHLNGTISTYADDATVKDRVHRERVARRHRELKASAAAASNAAEIAQRQERTEADRLAVLRQQTSRLEAELEQLLHIGEHDSNLAAQQQAQQKLSAAMATEQAQAEAMAAAVTAARAAESQRDALLLELTHTRHEHEKLEPTTEAEAAANHLAAPRRAARERRAAEREMAAVHRAEEAAALAQEAREAEAAQQLEAARAGHTRAVAALRQRVAAERQGEGMVDEKRGEELDRRAEAVVQLKGSIEGAASEMRSAAARRAERLAKQAKAREVEKADILAKGGNPYMVFRQRDEEARLARERKKMDATLASNMSQLQGRIVQQYKEEAHQRETAAAHKAAVEAKAKAISANGKEVANNKCARARSRRPGRAARATCRARGPPVQTCTPCTPCTPCVRPLRRARPAACVVAGTCSR